MTFKCISFAGTPYLLMGLVNVSYLAQESQILNLEPQISILVGLVSLMDTQLQTEELLRTLAKDNRVATDYDMSHLTGTSVGLPGHWQVSVAGLEVGLYMSKLP